MYTLMIYKITGTYTQDDCFVIDQETKLNATCSFPFVFENKIYYGCTTDLKIAGENILACSTKTTSDYKHIEGKKYYIVIL